MYHKIILFICTLVLSVTGQAQPQTTLRHYVAAEQMVSGQGKIVHHIDLEQNATPGVRLLRAVTEQVSGIPPQVKSSNSFDPDVTVAMARKKAQAIIEIPQYRSLNGKTERLVSYELEITEQIQGTVAQKPNFVENSVLATGSWYKIAVTQRGVHKIDYNFLQQMGINPATVNPAKIRIYGNGGTVMDEKVIDDQADDLIENAIYVQGSGSSFGQNDYVLFYANGPRLWTPEVWNEIFLHTNNYYSDSSYYFLTFDLPGNGKRINTQNATGAADEEITLFNDYAVIDVDSYNVGSIGKVWWSNPMNSAGPSTLTQNLSMNLGSHTGPVKVEAYVGNTSDATGNNLRMRINGEQVENFSLGAINETTIIAVSQKNFEITPSGNTLNIQLKYEPAGNGVAYLDYIRCNYKRPLTFSNGQLDFRAFQSINAGQAGYRLQGATGSVKVWDITRPLEPVALTGQLEGNTLRFTRPGDSLREFIAFDGSQFLSPKFSGTVANQNLHGLAPADYLIITNKSLLPAAEELADFHRQLDQKRVAVITVDKIYNEFSSGGQDISGIRNFIKMCYDKAANEQDMPKNVLLLGAASFDYKDRISENTNIVPTYQTYQSLSDAGFATDDFFALLDHGENITNTGNLLDIGLGRIPAYTLEEARDVIAKIKNYTSSRSFGPWKNVVSYVADDKDKNGSMNHMQDCEAVAGYYDTASRITNVNKVYADAYKIVSTASGGRYPDVNKSINDQIFNGTFLMSYSGHGSPKRWADEAILTEDDYNSWQNNDKLPIIVTATCDFGRYDDPGERSAGAKLLMRRNGGAIAMVTTTQIVYAPQNTALNQAYTRTQFTPTGDGNYLSLGQALIRAKNSTAGAGVNNNKYAILGDPALVPQFPKHSVRTSSMSLLVNGEELQADTIMALGHYLLKGAVTDQQGNLLEDFNGSVYVSIFDKPRTVQTVNTTPGASPSFVLQNNTIAKVRGTVEAGRFTVEFVAPKDINYDYGQGKISYYAHDDKSDANGLDTGMVVGGFNESALADNDGPEVLPFIDDERFEEGGVTGPNPMLYVKLFDENGINVSGGSVGHDLIAILDDNVQEPYVMNNYYQSEEDDYRRGFVKFPLSNLPDGLHTIKVRAWDTYNNSGEGSITFEVRSKDEGVISTLYNYPNPVYQSTHIVFQHNQENEPMKVTVQFFSQDGRLVNTIKKDMQPTGNRTEIMWDGRADNGMQLSKGIYFYRLQIDTEKGIRASAYQKLVLLR